MHRPPVASPHGEIALVVSNNAGAYALERAKGAGVPAAVVSQEGVRLSSCFLNTGSRGFWSWTAST